jgi:collagenase-like PrtC family protease
MKLSVATNWDEVLIQELRDLPIHDFFGAVPSNVFGGGRPSLILPDVDESKAEEYIQKVHKSGKKFTYPLNAPCLNNMEYDDKGHQELLDHLGWLQDIKVDYVTVSIPYIVEIIKKQFPKLKVKVSVISHVNSVQRIKSWEDLGADIITVDPMYNRNFKLLESLSKAASCELELLLNDACLYQCPYLYYHYNICGHASQSTNPLKGFYVDYCITKCSLDLFSDLKEVIKSRWIRPEDLERYEEIGINYFKISGRRMSTKWLLNTAKAYSSRSYDGSLSDLLNFITIGVDDDMSSGQFQKYLTKDEFFKKEKLIKIGQLNPPKPYIDNKKLQGFLKGFEKKDCASECETCHYCENWAKKVIQYDLTEQKTKVYIDKLKELHDELVTSKLFKPTEQVASVNEDVRWNYEVKSIFNKVLKSIPVEFQEIAEKTVEKRAVNIAKERKDTTVCMDDLVQAFHSETPEIFQDDMKKELKYLGVITE